MESCGSSQKGSAFLEDSFLKHFFRLETASKIAYLSATRNDLCGNIVVEMGEHFGEMPMVRCKSSSGRLGQTH